MKKTAKEKGKPKDKPLYIYSLASKKELKEVSEISKKWKEVSILSVKLHIDLANSDAIRQIGGDVFVALIRHNYKLK